MSFKNKKKQTSEVSIIDSITIDDTFCAKSENRIFTLLLKSLIIYLITVGLIGSALTSTNTYFNQFIFNVIIAILSVILGLIYYNKITENIGDIAYLIVIILIDISYGVYVNSGFYTWMNDIIGVASVYFGLNDIGGYNQIIDNPPLTVTIAACYLGAIIAIIVTISLMKKMMYADIILDSVFILILPLYFRLEPNIIYFVMLISGIVFASIWKNTGKYNKNDNNCRFTIEKKDISYSYDIRSHLSAFIQLLIPILIIILLVYLVVPKDLYNFSSEKSSIKQDSDDFVETLITSGISGFFNRYDNKGGTSSGRLGGVNSIRLDYQPDLNLTYVPFNFEPVYIRSFVGGVYRPYENSWNRAEETMVNRNEYISLKKNYNDKSIYSAKGKMIVSNLDAERGEYALYYSQKDETISIGNTGERVFYPYFEGAALSDFHLSEGELQYWLTISKDNIPSIKKTIDLIDIPLDATPYEKAMYIKDYFYKNIPYTLRAGTTPFRKDFVNYFLDSQKKGYCVHFATSGTLMLRYLGVPARYVEGYVYDYSDTSTLIVHDDINVEDYYDGYALVENSKVISVDLTDANAHAWIEIYIDGIGWVPVELTPPSSDTEQNGNEFLSNFMDLFTFNEIESSDNNTSKNYTFRTETIRKILCIIIIFCIIIIIVPFLIYKLIVIYRYLNDDINTKLTKRYHSLLIKLTKRNDIIAAKHNYRDVLLSTDYKDKDELEKVISILEKAGFSNKSITEEEFSFCIAVFKKIKK